MDAMADIKQTFFQECEEQLAELEAGLVAMDEGQADAETVNAVFRSVHSIKGGAGAFQLSDLVQFAHKFETCLDHVRSGRLAATTDLMKVMLRAADVLADLVRAARDNTPVPPEAWEGIANELRAQYEGGTADADTQGSDDTAEFDNIDFQPLIVAVSDDAGVEGDVAAKSEYSINFRPNPELYAKANDAVLILRNLG
jgi:two-component system chemotaxis sensor kinase CheA